LNKIYILHSISAGLLAPSYSLLIHKYVIFWWMEWIFYHHTGQSYRVW